jgi:DivIVA domain-containing protein
MPGFLRPEDVAGKSFKAGWRGYDQGSVEEFLREVSSSIAALEAENDHLRDRLHRLGDRDMHEEFDRVSEELSSLLREARETAEGIRSRAAIGAEQITGEALEDATRLRQDAWNDGVAMLDAAQKEADEIVEDAKRSALVILSEAERDAHRIGSKARREAEEATRRARLQAEQVVVDARARRDALVQEGEAEVASAKERVGGLVQRRDELLGQVDSLQAKIVELRSELEDRRAAIGKARAAETTTVRVLPVRLPGEEPETGEPETEVAATKPPSGWEDADESVRIVPPPKRPRATSGVVDADQMAAEVRQLRVPKQRPTPVAPKPEPEPEPAPEFRPEPAPEAEALEVTSRPVEEAGPVRAIKDLFASLRAGDVTTPEPEGAAEPEADAEVDAEVETTLEAADESVFEEPAGVDPFDLRDRLLLPITNKTLRTVKRNLTEAQNIALDELRVQEEAWQPDVEALETSLDDDLAEVLQRSVAAGWEAAGRLLGRDVGEGGVEVEGSPAHEFAEAIGVGVRKALDGAGDGPRRRAAAISRVYRAWRVDEAERKVRALALGAYHDGLLAAFAHVGVDSVRWVVSGRPCTTCRAMVEAGPVAPGTLFGGETIRPPAHPSCECTLTPI